MPKKKPPLNVDKAIKLREPFGFSILSKVDEGWLNRQVIRLSKGACIEQEAGYLANQSGASIKECKDYLKATFGYTKEEHEAFVKKSLEVINDKILQRLHKEVDDIPTKDLTKTFATLQSQALVLDGKPSSISASTSVKIGGSSIEEIRQKYLKEAQEKQAEVIDVTDTNQ